MADTVITVGDLRAGDVFRDAGSLAEWRVSAADRGLLTVALTVVLIGGSGKSATMRERATRRVLLVERPEHCRGDGDCPACGADILGNDPHGDGCPRGDRVRPAGAYQCQVCGRVLYTAAAWRQHRYDAHAEDGR
jgi:hypothetical protein